jgi:hypothetical protein
MAVAFDFRLNDGFKRPQEKRFLLRIVLSGF